MSAAWLNSSFRSLLGKQRWSGLLICSVLLLACHHGPDTVDGDSGFDLGIGTDDGGPRDSGAIHDADTQDAAPPDAELPQDAGTDGPRPPDMTGGTDGGMTGDMAGDMASTPTRLRVMAANTTSGNYQSYDPGEGIRIFQGLHPDVALIQEFNYGDNSDGVIRGFVDTTFGTTFSYFRESGAQIPNGIASRYPIVSSGKWTDPAVSNRGFAWARIDVPGAKDLWAISIHLLTSSAANRDKEAVALVAEINRAIPTTDYVVIGGDLNTGTRTETCLTTLSAVVSVAAPYPADGAGNSNTSGSRSKPLDWVMPSLNLRMLETGVVIGAQSFTNGLVVDSRVYMPLSDISPVKVGDSGATQMQHMAVVEDFLLP